MKKIVLITMLGIALLYSKGTNLYGGPALTYSIVNSSFATLVGGEVGYFVDKEKKTFVSLNYNLLASDIKIGGSGTNKDKYIGLKYGGIVFGTDVYKKIFVRLMIGWSDISMLSSVDTSGGGSGSFVSEYGVEYRGKKLKNFVLGLSYRLIDRWPNEELKEAKLSGINFHLKFNFGSKE